LSILYSTYHLFATLGSHYCCGACSRRCKAPFGTRPNPAIVTAHWKFILRAPRDPTPSNSPPSKKVQHILTLAQTHQARRQQHPRLFKASRNLQHHTRSTLDPAELLWTASVTQFHALSGTSRPHAAAVLFFTPVHPEHHRRFRTSPVPLLKMDDRFSPRSAHSDDALAQNIHDPMFEPQPSFDFADSHNEEPRPLQPSMGSPNAPNQNQQTFFNPLNGTR
jgi:hypothetical protein